MTTLAARACMGLVLASVFLTGCSNDGSDEQPTPKDAPTAEASGSPTASASGSPQASASASGSPRASASASPTAPTAVLGSKQCSLGRERLSLVVRDWGRVAGSVGREDHATYTGAFATTLARLRPAAQTCNGAAYLDRFLVDVRRIDASARRPTPAYALYDVAVKSGNIWLNKVGYGNNALSVG